MSSHGLTVSESCPECGRRVKGSLASHLAQCPALVDESQQPAETGPDTEPAQDSQKPDEVPVKVWDNPILYRNAWQRMHDRDENWMATVCGETGSGKSIAALAIADTLDPDFSIEQVAFSVEEFMRLVMDDSYGAGDLIVFEEASVEASAYDWWDKSNRVLRQVADTWRHQNRGVIFTLPEFSKLDKSVRGRIHGYIEMREKHYLKEPPYTVARYHRLQQNPFSGKLYRHALDLGYKEYKDLKITLPSDDLLEDYEAAKEEYTEELNAELLQELLEEQQNEENQSPADGPGWREIAEEIIDEGRVQEFVANNHGQRYIDRDLIQMDYDVGKGRSKKVKKRLLQEVDDDVM